MKFNIHGKNIEVTEAIRGYIESKIGRVEKYFKDTDLAATVTIRVRGKEQIVEVTIPASKMVLRAEEKHSDLYAAVDLVSDKLERQIRKNKTKARKNLKQTIIFNDFDVDASEDVDDSIVKRKVIDTKPMSEEEAILQMELIGHDFFLFKNDKTNELCVVYKRKDKGYGILEAR
ncbi:MAG: ribosome hibernation-promoting factor, HPF/YfiA family [Bacilli bacterium]